MNVNALVAAMVLADGRALALMLAELDAADARLVAHGLERGDFAEVLFAEACAPARRFGAAFALAFQDLARQAGRRAVVS